MDDGVVGWRLRVVPIIFVLAVLVFVLLGDSRLNR